MKHNYTWSHLLLLAKICQRIDDDDSVTASWVEIVENHHKKTFPFTLWPLSYRTSDVTTSPSISSPILLSGEELGCNFAVKMYRCNEVIIVCVQEDNENTKPKLECSKHCRVEDDFSGFDGNDDFHSLHHSTSNTKPLLKCKTAHTYFKIKEKAMSSLYEIQQGTLDDISSIIVTGFGESAHVASCLAVDISRGYEIEREFLGMETKRICVDFFGFSHGIKASPVYWDSPTLSIDMYMSIILSDLKPETGTELIENPLNRTIRLRENTLLPCKYKIFRFKKKKKKKTELKENIDDYIECIENKIVILNKK